ncbi:MAG: hypothetical protein KDB69_08325, partial [Acidimicrobiia bacterium]|nr:hypothetical protein [Acidimicrobiia bacterium]
MIPGTLTFEASDFQATVVPAAWTKYVSVGDSSITVTGDMTAYRDLHLWVGDDRMVVSLHFGELLDELHRLGVGTRISEFGLAAMLTNGLIPMQHSLFEDIAVLSNGDVARIDLGPDGRFRVTWDFDYPWIESKSRGDEVADPDRMLDMLTESTERQLDEYGGSGFLMLSGGKDSPAIALALATAGRTDVP